MGWTREAHVSVEMLESVRGLNSRFLDLAAVQSGHPPFGDWNFPIQVGLSANVSAQIAPLSAAQKAAAANCPYALFDLRFRDDRHWRMRFGGDGRWSVADAAPVHANTLDFVRLALFFAWHVASAGKVAAQLLLGMSEGTVAAFRAAAIDCLPAVAAMEAVHLTARWNDCPAYWGALADAAARPNAAGLRKIQLYGLQLAAAARLT
jgi:hypothetical protein